MNDNKNEQFEYKAEMKQLLHLIIHSLYTNPEVFLRELVSNASDALNKIRFRRVTDSNIFQPEADLKIKITLDKDNNLFSIEDSGIGMTKEELINNIGTVASSGTLQFLKSLQESKQSLDGNLIGQFGVGFYSVFMVTDKITVETHSANPDAKAYKWESEGENTFTIEEIEKENRGTKIYFQLKDDYKDFLEPNRVKAVLKKYSNFVDFPIFVGEEEVNTVSALWHKKKEDLKEEEVNEFYKFISNDFQNPLCYIHFSIEGNINFKALLFIPASAPMSLFKETYEKSVQLYSNKVFIQDDHKDLIPDYLRFLKGVIDTEDLPLNVSREVTQNSPVVAKIRSVVINKVLSFLEDLATNDQEKYKTFYKNFGSLFKTGLNSDFANKKRILELLRFESSELPKGETTSLFSYVTRMKTDQKEIYYVMGDHRDLIEKNPNLEYFKKKGIEVLFMTDPVDFFTIPYVADFDGKPLKSTDKAEIDFSADKDDTKQLDETQKGSIINTFKDVLKDKVEDVKESKRLVDSPVTLVVGKSGFDPQMEKMMQMIDKTYTNSKKILEINLNHKLIRNIIDLKAKNDSDELVNNLINQLYEGVLLMEGQLKSPADFVKRMTQLMELASVSK